ncbi:hypothetical protein FKP32DRAFT_575491 [Trametes sanguinea]|nr:hypothetical protein FKP32DRAFT_575491 [Trametes sanguinea]
MLRALPTLFRAYSRVQQHSCTNPAFGGESRTRWWSGGSHSVPRRFDPDLLRHRSRSSEDDTTTTNARADGRNVSHGRARVLTLLLRVSRSSFGAKKRRRACWDGWVVSGLGGLGGWTGRIGQMVRRSAARGEVVVYSKGCAPGVVAAAAAVRTWIFEELMEEAACGTLPTVCRKFAREGASGLALDQDELCLKKRPQGL